jgi:hypothetical protein
MISRLFDELQRLEGIRFHRGADASLVAQLESVHGIVLPGDHKDALKLSNGVEAYRGYFRLFGAYTSETIDSVVWNQAETWKFALGTRCSDFWCFGETAWGDQYAYSLESLREGGDTRVYFLESSSMTPRIWAPSFAEFFDKEFVRSAKLPYDSMTRQAYQKLGMIETNCHLVYTPSLLLGGTEDINNVQKLNARSAMICNGDVATELDAAPDEKILKEVQPYEDDLHRSRLRLVWA